MDYEFDYWHYIYISGEYYPSISIQTITEIHTGANVDRKDSIED